MSKLLLNYLQLMSYKNSRYSLFCVPFKTRRINPPVPIPSFQVPQRQDDFALLLPPHLPQLPSSAPALPGESSTGTRRAQLAHSVLIEVDCFIVRNLELTRDNWVILGIVNTLKRCSCSLWLRRPTSRIWRMIPLMVSYHPLRAAASLLSLSTSLRYLWL